MTKEPPIKTVTYQAPENMVPVEYIAVPLGMTTQGVRKWCGAGEVPGARKVGRVWYIPKNTADRILSGGIKVGGAKKK